MTIKFKYFFSLIAVGAFFWVLLVSPVQAGCIPNNQTGPVLSPTNPCNQRETCCSPDAICQAIKRSETSMITGMITWSVECLPPSGERPIEEIEEKEIVTPKLQVKIPGFEGFTKNIEQGEDQYTIPWLGEYISAIYQCSLRAITLLAIVMMMIAGFQWMMAAGNIPKIQQAKSRITGALIGLILLLGVNLILSVVNPQLVFLRPITIGRIKGITLIAEGEFSSVQIPEDWTRTSNDTPHLLQCDSQWDTKPYLGDCPGNTSRNENSVCASGCGIVSLAMITQHYFDTPVQGAMDPPDVAQWLVAQGYRSPGGKTGATCNGISYQAIEDAAWSLSRLHSEQILSFSGADAVLKEGEPLIAHVRNPAGCGKEPRTCKFTSCGHYIVVSGVDDNGIYSINDSGSSSSERFYATQEELAEECQLVGFIYLYPPK